ncbi:MAG: NAD(P)-dependent oxidoreductase [Gammaproteobacteria bacterium]|nr:NAD(P)-dependent oxidoreductase [Gammaproteobacteria bacterium]MDH5801215.1 NAD(P)-dependent oxidoreductase [Gammaproteobacteria bacterium]
MKNKILITGATGYIGSRLVGYLLKRGYEVSVTLRAGSDLTGLGGKVVEQNIITLYENETAASLASRFCELKPDLVVHLASHYVSEHKLEHVESLIDSNVLFGSQLLEAMDRSSCKNLLNIGTSWQHYNNNVYEPVNLYSATKQAFLDIAAYYHKARGFKIIDLKLFDTFGPNDSRKKLIPLLIKNLGLDTEIKLSPGEQHINLVFIDDVLNCLEMGVSRLLSESQNDMEEYMVSAESTISIKELVKTIEKVSQKSLSVQWGANQYRNREVMRPWDRGLILPGWSPKVSLEEGLQRVINC